VILRPAPLLLLIVLPLAHLAGAPPSVSLTSPPPGVRYPGNVAFTANASDSDGTIAKVEYFNGVTKLGEATASPYGFTWTNVPAGTYLLTAKATDNVGDTATSSVTTVEVRTPLALSQTFDSMGTNGTTPPAGWSIKNGASGTANSTWTSGITANGASGSVASMVNAAGALTATTTPTANNNSGYNAARTSTNTPDRVIATAPTSVSGVAIQWQVTNSDGVAISGIRLGYEIVRYAAAGSANELPGYWLFYSLDGGTTWTNVAALNPTLSGPDGVIVPNTAGITTVAPTNVTLSGLWTNGGTLLFRWVDDNAVATSPDQIYGLDNVTLTATTAAVGSPPVVALTAPLATNVFTAPATIAITASASDPDGSVTKVEFYNGAAKLAEATNAPYAFSWSNVLAGSYTLTAQATDNSSNVTTSSAVNVTVSPPAGAPVVTRGPYLQLGTPTNLTVRWRTDLTVVGVVRYGTNLASLTNSAAGVSTTEHAVTVTNLAPATRYHYSIGTSNFVIAGGDTNHFFTTSPPPGTPRPTRIWVLGDSGTGTANQTAVRDAYYALAAAEGRGTDLWLMLGDNAYNNGTDAEYQSTVFNIYGDVLRNSVLWPTLGNHDTAQATTFTNTYPYYSIFTLPTQREAGGIASGTEAYYSFDHGNIHFICLDSMTASRATNGAMMTWLKNDLAGTTQLWIIAFWHHPPYTKGSHDSDTESNLIQMRERFVPVLEEGGVDLVLSGHSHSYERSKFITGFYATPTTAGGGTFINAGSGRTNDPLGVYAKSLSAPIADQGAVYLVAGSSGQISGGPLNHPVMYVSSNHLASLVVDIDDNRLSARAIHANGSILDRFEIVKRPDVTSSTVSNAAEFGAVAGVVTVQRTGHNGFNLSLPVSFSGSATPGTDYVAPPTNLTLAAGQSTVSVAFVPIPDSLAEGPETVTLTVLSNALHRVGASNAASIVIADKPIDTWRWQRFGANANSPAAADLADADGDGVWNVIEYGLDLDPLASSSAQLPQAVLTGAPPRLQLQFSRDPARLDVTLRVRASDDLTTWSNICTSAQSGPPTGPGFVSETTNHPPTVTVQDPVAVPDAMRRFLRLEVERHP
jgi:hypothetical protein